MHALKRVSAGENSLVLLPRKDRGFEDIVTEGKLLKALSASVALDPKVFFVKERPAHGPVALDAAAEARLASFINGLDVEDVVAEQPIAVIENRGREQVVYRSVKSKRIDAQLFQLKLLKALISLDALGVIPGEVVRAEDGLHALYGEDDKLHFFDLESWSVRDGRVLKSLA